MKKSLVLIGGVLGIMAVAGCGGSHPPLERAPDSSRMYNGYKGDASRCGYTNGDEDIEFNPLWQIKFRQPLFNQAALAGDFAFQPGADKKIHVIDINTGEEVAEIKVRRHVGSTPELFGPFMAICEEGENSELLVINYIEGRIAWKAKTDRLCLQPVLFNNRIFWVDGKNRVNAAHLEDGERLWKRNIERGFDAGPILCNDNIIVPGRDSLIYCLDPETGEILWQRKNPGRTNSSPACFEEKIYICNANGVVVCFDALTGDLLWSHEDGSRLFYSPSVDADGVYFGSGDGRFVKLNRLTGVKIWEYNTGSPVRGTALINAKAVIFSSLDHTVYALDKYSGRPISSFIAGGMISAAPILYNNRLFIAAQDRFLNCFSLKGE